MLCVPKLKRHPRQFRAFTGLTITEFDRLLSEIQSPYDTAVRQRQVASPRRRKPGAGRPGALALSERLLMGLIYMRLYVSQRLVSFLFDIDQSNVCRELNDRLMPVLLAVLPVPLRDAPLRNAPLRNAPVRNAPLRNAPLRNAPLRNAPLRNAPLRNASELQHDANAISESPSQANDRTKSNPRRISTLKELLETYPDLSEVLIDAAEEPIPQPEDKLKRK